MRPPCAPSTAIAPALGTVLACAVLASCNGCGAHTIDVTGSAEPQASNAAAPPASLAAPGPRLVVIEGRTITLPAIEHDDGSRAHDALVAALRDHAAAIIPCKAADVQVREVSVGEEAHATTRVLADGCGERVVYAHVSSKPATAPYDKYLVLARFPIARGAGAP